MITVLRFFYGLYEEGLAKIGDFIMRKVLLIGYLCLCANFLSAQITIMEDNEQAKVISKPQAFDSLSNLTFTTNPIQYKKYVGYKLYCLPISNKYQTNKTDYYFKEFRYTSPRQFELPHTKGLKSLNMVGKKAFIISTDVYKVAYSGDEFEAPPTLPKEYEPYLYTPYDSIQNTYFTILNIEAANSSNGQYLPLDKWDCKQCRYQILRFTLKNESSGEEIFWYHNTFNKNQEFFLVPYFEKMQKTYKNQKVVANKDFSNLKDINTGTSILLRPGDVWYCYDVTFVNLNDKKYIQPFVFLENDGVKVMVPFDDFNASCIAYVDNHTHSAFMLEQDYNNIYNQVVAERNQAFEEQKQLKKKNREN